MSRSDLLRHRSPCTKSIIWKCAPIKPPALGSREHHFPQGCLWKESSYKQKRAEISSTLYSLQTFSIKRIVLGLLTRSQYCSDAWGQLPKKYPHRKTRSPLEKKSLENIQRQNCSSKWWVIQNYIDYGLPGPKHVIESVHHDGQLPCYRFTPKLKGSSFWNLCNPGKMGRTGGLKLPEKHVNKNISTMSYSTGGTKAWITVKLSKRPFHTPCASFRVETLCTVMEYSTA